MYVCMFVCLFVCLFVCMFVCFYVCMFVCMHVSMHACMYVFCLLESQSESLNQDAGLLDTSRIAAWVRKRIYKVM